MPQFLMRPLALPLLLAAALLIGCNVEADFSDQLETETLVAEEYQHEIAAIDRLLFREEPLGDNGVRELETLLDTLSKRVKAHRDTKFMKVESLELQLLAKRAARLSPQGTGVSLQNDWMRIRNNLFDDRAWFARSAADLEEQAATVVQPKPAAPQVPAVAYEHRDALSGRWRVVSVTANGEPRSDEELTGSVWTFEVPRLTMRSANGTESSYNFTPDGTFLRLDVPGGREGWLRYELANGGLRVAFYDGLGEKPPGFVATQKEPMLVVVQLAAIQ